MKLLIILLSIFGLSLTGGLFVLEVHDQSGTKKACLILSDFIVGLEHEDSGPNSKIKVAITKGKEEQKEEGKIKEKVENFKVRACNINDKEVLHLPITSEFDFSIPETTSYHILEQQKVNEFISKYLVPNYIEKSNNDDVRTSDDDPLSFQKLNSLQSFTKTELRNSNGDNLVDKLQYAALDFFGIYLDEDGKDKK
jgi:hypothetical protein